MNTYILKIDSFILSQMTIHNSLKKRSSIIWAWFAKKANPPQPIKTFTRVIGVAVLQSSKLNWSHTRFSKDANNDRRVSVIARNSKANKTTLINLLKWFRPFLTHNWESWKFLRSDLYLRTKPATKPSWRVSSKLRVWAEWANPWKSWKHTPRKSTRVKIVIQRVWNGVTLSNSPNS